MTGKSRSPARPRRARDVGPPSRHDGYAPISDYAAVGDGRTVALIARDGAVDWLCLPDLDSPAIFAALLDPDRGGRATLAPEGAYDVTRRYLPGTNVLETTFVAGEGSVRVTDAMTLPTARLHPSRELVRRIEGLSGTVTMRWSVEPRFGYGAKPTRLGRRVGMPVATAGNQALGVCSWGAGEPEVDARGVRGRFDVHPGTTALITLCGADQEPLLFPARREVEGRLDDTVARWRRWAGCPAYDGPWQETVERSVLALKLLIYAPSGALAAAATTSLPEEVGGVRNWDYRFCWVRDSAFTLNALLELGYADEAEGFFWWLMQASQLTQPRLDVLYRLNGGAGRGERVLSLRGYRGSAPARTGNAAVDQLQLDVYGDVLQTAWLATRAGHALDADIVRRLAGSATLVAEAWRRPDAGIWEVRSQPAQFTHSKIMCWVALDRALAMSESRPVPDRHAARWRTERHAIREFVEQHCWSQAKGSYVRTAGGDDVDASLLLAILFGHLDARSERALGTIDAVRRELGRGPLLYRYRCGDGLSGREGAFLACSFWLVDALARAGQLDAAGALMDDLVGLANDVGLYAEEMDVDSGDFLGNFPQALTHLALINAAVTLAKEMSR